VVVSNPAKTRAIAEAKVKTDKVDAQILAQLLVADYLPAVWLPDAATNALRRGGDPPGRSGPGPHSVQEPGACDPAPQPGSPLPGLGSVRPQGTVYRARTLVGRHSC
jgi:hypothetical protein